MLMLMLGPCTGESHAHAGVNADAGFLAVLSELNIEQLKLTKSKIQSLLCHIE